MLSNTHVIQRQRFELELASGEDAVALQNRFTDVYSNQVLPALEGIFDGLAGPGTVINLDELTIDLGRIDPTVTDALLADQLLEQFTEHITRKVQHHRAAVQADAAAPQTTGSTLDLLRHFFRLGRLPWWAGADSVTVLVQRLLKEQPQDFIAMLRLTAEAPNVRKRLRNQLRVGEQLAIARLLLSTNAASTENAIKKALDTLVWAIARPTLTALQTLQAIALLEYALDATSTKRTKTSAPPPATEARQLKQWVANTIAGAAPAKARAYGVPTQEEPSKRNPVAELATETKQATKKSPASPDEQVAALAAEGVYIANAGMILLWPFYELFFADMGYLDNGKWPSEEHQERAALMLQYLTTGKVETEEHELLLNKVICDLPLDHPLPMELELTDREQEKAHLFLTSVIKHWGVLGDVVPAQLQHTYLIREGRLSQVADGWQLVVEQKAYDIMLDRLPWGIGTVMLPWLAGTIDVEWA